MKKLIDSTTIIITTKDNRVLLQKRDNKPNIEYPSCYSLISGYLEECETPLEGIIRELKEEFEHKANKSVCFSSISYLGSNYRPDFKRWEYVHHTFLLDDENDLKILEGEGFGMFDIEECLTLENLVHHHKLYLNQYKDDVLKINFQEQSKKEFDKINIHDFIKIETLRDVKDYSFLEKGLGFVTGGHNDFSASIPAKEPIKYIGLLQFAPNVARGNHFHFRKVEYMIILRGEMLAKLQRHNKKDDCIEIIWKKGQIIRTLPGCIHTLTALGDSNTVTIELSPQDYIGSDVINNEEE
jgi:ADP-ribose pyrophosphatase YjhB (NUDIX family)